MYAIQTMCKSVALFRKPTYAAVVNYGLSDVCLPQIREVATLSPSEDQVIVVVMLICRE